MKQIILTSTALLVGLICLPAIMAQTTTTSCNNQSYYSGRFCAGGGYLSGTCKAGWIYYCSGPGLVAQPVQYCTQGMCTTAGPGVAYCNVRASQYIWHQ